MSARHPARRCASCYWWRERDGEGWCAVRYQRRLRRVVTRDGIERECSMYDDSPREPWMGGGRDAL